VVAARGNEPGDGAGSALWATANVRVDGSDPVTTALELRSGFVVSGRIQFVGETKPPADVRGWRINLTSSLQPGQIGLGASPAEVEVDGTFTIRGVTPGTYTLTAAPPSAASNSWTVRSIAVAERNAWDVPIAVHGDTDNVVVTFTDRISQISGRLQDASGAPASDYHVIVFPVDPALWTLRGTQRIQAVRPATDGQYKVKLPPGEYLLVAMTDVEPDEWSDPSFLQRIAGSALKMSIAEGEQKVQDFKIGG
jgi:hypothetical protein